MNHLKERYQYLFTILVIGLLASSVSFAMAQSDSTGHLEILRAGPYINYVNGIPAIVDPDETVHLVF